MTHVPLRDLLHLAALVVMGAFLAGLVSNILVGVIATIVDAWRDAQDHIDQDYADAATIRASRPRDQAGRWQA